MTLARRMALTLAFLLHFLAMTSHAQQTPPVTEREKISYMVGLDVSRSLTGIGTNLDIAAFERAVRNTLAGGAELLPREEARTVAMALSARMNGDAAGAPLVPEKVGLMVGGEIGRALLSIKDEIDVAVFVQSVRGQLAGAPALMTDAEASAVREAFSRRMQGEVGARAAALAEKNAAEGAAFLAQNKAKTGVSVTASGLQYEVLQPGTGTQPTAASTVQVHYRGLLLDGTEFDSSYSRGEPTSFGLNQVIAGWTEGIALMQVGAKFRFWIPAAIGYGDDGAPPVIPPGATLVFEVELLGVR